MDYNLNRIDAIIMTSNAGCRSTAWAKTIDQMTTDERATFALILYNTTNYNTGLGSRLHITEADIRKLNNRLGR